MDLNLLQSLAGEEFLHPKNDNIPKQKFPGWIRWLIKTLILPFLWIDQIAQKIAKVVIRPPFTRVGSCKRRGNCCRYILFRKQKPFFDRLLKFWSTEVNGFFLREKLPQKYDGKHWWIMGCRYLKENGECSHYFYRPAICRKWPIIEHFGRPQVLKGCGFKAVPRKKNAALQILKELE